MSNMMQWLSIITITIIIMRTILCNKREIKWQHLKSSEPQKIKVFEGMIPVFAYCFYFANRHDSTQCYLEALLEQGWQIHLQSEQQNKTVAQSCQRHPAKRRTVVLGVELPGAQVQAQESEVIICELYSWGPCRLSPCKSYCTLAVL